MADYDRCAFRSSRAALVKCLATCLCAAFASREASSQLLHEHAKLLASDGHAGGQLGHSVSISGQIALVGAPYGDIIGSVYVFRRTSRGWMQAAKLLPSDGLPGDEFGWSVSIDGTRALVAAPRHDHVFQGGAAYVFEYVGEAWVEDAKLLMPGLSPFDYTAKSVSLHGDRALIGAPTMVDAACIFLRTAGGWVSEAVLFPSDLASISDFGWSVSIRGDRALVGARQGNHDVEGFYKGGAAYVYRRTASGWVELAKLVPLDAASEDRFGCAVALGEGRAVVGAHDIYGMSIGSGAAYVFVETPNGWEQEAKLVAEDGKGGDDFGDAVAIAGDRIVVGAPLHDLAAVAGGNEGAAYVFERAPAGWVLRTKLEASDGMGGDQLGHSVAISEHRALVGARWDDDLGTDAGSAYVLDLGMPGCTVREGTLGLDPRDYACETKPALGEVWSAKVATEPLVGIATVTTFVAVGLGGPVEGVPLLEYELLVLPPFDPLLVSPTGDHALAIPFDGSLVGAVVATQGARVEEIAGGGLVVVLTNAIDLALGL